MTPIKLVLDQGVQRNEALKKVSFTALKGREGANGLICKKGFAAGI